jgi:hypothetical protein
MSFFKGVSTDAAADPLTVSNLTDVIGYIFANPNGVTGSEANGSFSVADITALQQAVASNAAAATSS